MDLREFLSVARSRWKLILALTVATVALAAAFTVVATPTYSSSARLFVSSSERDSSQAYQGSLFSAARITSYADLVTSRRLSRAVIDDLDVELSPSDLASKLTASVTPETLILLITATDPDPRQAQRIAQATAERLTELVAELETPPGKDNAPIKATVVDDAPLPTTPISPQPARNLAIGLMLGLLLGLGVAILREMLDVTVKTPRDVTEAVGIPVLGSIGYDPAAVKEPLLTARNASTPRVEAFRVLRTNMQFVDVDSDSRVFTVTSSVPGEAKTSTATNLAIVLAQAGQRVLLLEGDLRRPRIHLSSELEQQVGLTTVLVGRASLEEAVQTSGVANLSVLTSGAVPPNPAELLQSNAMAAVLAEARTNYDVVIIDAPPLLPVTDAALLAAQSDGALIVIRHGKTTTDQLRQAVERLIAVGGRPVGAVLNMVPHRRHPGDYTPYAYGYTAERGAPDQSSLAVPPDVPSDASQNRSSTEAPSASNSEERPGKRTANGLGTGWPELPRTGRPSSESKRP